ANGPSPDAIAKYAAKAPDRWAQGVAVAGRLAGYTERSEMDVSGTIHHVHHLSDAELDARILALEAEGSPTVIQLPPHKAPVRKSDKKSAPVLPDPARSKPRRQSKHTAVRQAPTAPGEGALREASG